MSKMGQFVLECQTAAEEAYATGADVEVVIEDQFSDRPYLVSYAKEVAKDYLWEEIPFE